MAFKVVREVGAPKGRTIRDVAIRLAGQGTSSEYPEELRLVEAWVEVKGKLVRMLLFLMVTVVFVFDMTS